MEVKEILSKCDHTALSVTATIDDILNLIDEGIEYGTASVCIPPCHVEPAVGYSQGRVKICTVIGFPNGYNTTASKVFEAKDAIEKGADEIDMVINLGLLKSGKVGYVENEIRQVKQACGDKV
ncbi:MAG: deoxyribose-phosphate aldolase, partial [Clostridia bacterium]|nr:deoxyribose-phosphate aldolase [Clostridia bacterium]